MTTLDKHDSLTESAPTDFAGRGNPTAVETPTTLRRPNPNGDEKIPTGSPPNKGAAKKRLRRALAAGAALVVALAAGVYYFRFVVPFESTDDAFIEGHVTPIASKVPGCVAQLLIKDNQWVKKGDVLLKIDPRDYETSLAQTRADLEAARSQLDESQAQVKVSEAKVVAGYSRSDCRRRGKSTCRGRSQALRVSGQDARFHEARLTRRSRRRATARPIWKPRAARSKPPKRKWP